MDLLAKVIVAAVIVAVLLVAVYFALTRITTLAPVTKAQAVAAVMSDIQNAYPTAYVNITEVVPSSFAGSWHIVASVVFNSTKPCPTYYVWSYDYPKYGFVPSTENTYTSDCVVYGMLQNKSYILASAPVAIARSYNLSVPSIKDFVNKYGYANTIVHASFYNSTSLLGKSYSNIWLVNYSALNANYSVYAVISQVGGNLLLNYTVAH